MLTHRKDNFLDYIPVRNPANEWDKNKKGIVTIHLVQKGFFKWMTQVTIHKPKVSHIDLDEYGSFIWELIDGKNTVYDIGEQLKAKYGEKAEPLYDRLTNYMRILRNNKFIFLTEKKKK